jgi:hypothetical protein
MWTLSMPNLFADEQRLIIYFPLSHRDAKNLVLKTWLAMTLGLASPSNEQLRSAEPSVPM